MLKVCHTAGTDTAADNVLTHGSVSHAVNAPSKNSKAEAQHGVQQKLLGTGRAQHHGSAWPPHADSANSLRPREETDCQGDPTNMTAHEWLNFISVVSRQFWEGREESGGSTAASRLLKSTVTFSWCLGFFLSFFPSSSRK